MAQLDQRRGFQKAGAPLDGVETAENAVQQTGIFGVVFKVDQSNIHVVQQLGRLSEEIGQQVLHFGKG